MSVAAPAPAAAPVISSGVMGSQPDWYRPISVSATSWMMAEQPDTRSRASNEGSQRLCEDFTITEKAIVKLRVILAKVRLKL